MSKSFKLEDKEGKAFTYFEVGYVKSAGLDQYETILNIFTINTLRAYQVSKQFGNMQDQFMEELQKLHDDFYDWVDTAHEKDLVKWIMPEKDFKGQQEVIQVVHDYFLPRQLAFAKKWGLSVNED